MSGAGGADGSASATGFFNPAGVAWTKGLALHMGFGESLWMQDYSEYALSLGRGFAPYGDENGWKLAGRLSWVRAAAGQRYLCCLEPGEDNYYLSGTAAVGRRQGVAEIALGGAVRYVEHRDRYYYHVWSYDLGTILALNFDRNESVRFRPRIGASARNLGPDIEYWNHYYSWEPLRRYSYEQLQVRLPGLSRIDHPGHRAQRRLRMGGPAVRLRGPHEQRRRIFENRESIQHHPLHESDAVLPGRMIAAPHGWRKTRQRAAAYSLPSV